MQKILIDIDRSENSTPDVEITMNIIIRDCFSYLLKVMTSNVRGFTTSNEIYQFLPDSCVKMRAISKS